MSRFAPLFSGSSGNSIAIGGKDSYILVDAGTSARRICNALTEREFDIDRLAAVFVTHEHTDHVSALRVLCGKRNIPVYATAGTLCAAGASGYLDGVKVDVVPKEGMETAGIFVKPFPTMHDTAESCGYVVYTADGRTVAVATDMGCITDSVRSALTGCDLAYIESNHDIELLKNGSYEYYLKQRILGTRGHLSNVDCAGELTRLAVMGTTRFVLAHLSRDNNRPEIAREASLMALCSTGMREGRDFSLQVAAPDGLPLTIF